MANKRNIEIQDHEGNIYNPHTAAKVVFLEDGKNVESQLAQMATEMELVKQSGVNAKSKMVTSINSKKTVPDVTVNDAWDTMAQRVADIKEGSGNAVKADVRRGKTFTNNDGVEYTGELDISADKILKGQNIGGVVGTATSDANAVASDMLSGKTAYVNGAKITGSIPVRPSDTTASEVHAYSYLNQGLHNVYMRVPPGYYNETWLGFNEPSLKPENIKKGVAIGSNVGLVGTLEPLDNLMNPVTVSNALAPGYKIVCFNRDTFVREDNEGVQEVYLNGTIKQRFYYTYEEGLKMYPSNLFADKVIYISASYDVRTCIKDRNGTRLHMYNIHGGRALNEYVWATALGVIYNFEGTRLSSSSAVDSFITTNPFGTITFKDTSSASAVLGKVNNKKNSTMDIIGDFRNEIDSMLVAMLCR